MKYILSKPYTVSKSPNYSSLNINFNTINLQVVSTGYLSTVGRWGQVNRGSIDPCRWFKQINGPFGSIHNYC